MIATEGMGRAVKYDEALGAKTLPGSAVYMAVRPGDWAVCADNVELRARAVTIGLDSTPKVWYAVEGAT